jgi:hypothetical protein
VSPTAKGPLLTVIAVFRSVSFTIGCEHIGAVLSKIDTNLVHDRIRGL